MSKKNYKSQASSSRVIPSGSGPVSGFSGNSLVSGFGVSPPSSLSYVYEPPELSLISDSNIQKAFKSLQKRDSVTKSKALEDLQAHLTALHDQGLSIQDSILEAWVRQLTISFWSDHNLMCSDYSLPEDIHR